MPPGIGYGPPQQQPELQPRPPGLNYLQRSVTREITMPGGTGEGFDEKADPRFKAAVQTMERLTYYADALKDHFDSAEKYWRMYLLQRKDNFKPWEYWRNKVVTAHPNTVIEVSTAALVAQVLSHVPPIQPEATVSVGKELLTKKMLDWWSYALRSNKFDRELELFVREMLIQSIAIRKNALIEKSREIIYFPSEAVAQEFDDKLGLVIEQGIQPPQPEEFEDMNTFKRSFEEFRGAVNAATGIGLPEFPLAGPRKITHYKGPGWKRISMFNMFYDPMVAIHEQEDMMLVSSVDESWVRKNADPSNPNAPYDAELVEYCLKGSNAARADIVDSQGKNPYEQRLANLVNSSAGSVDKPHPGKKKPVFLVEHYFPSSKIPYRVVLNGRACINRRKSNPWEHGDFPFTIATNINVPFISSGLSDLKAGESLFKETNKLRGLTLDGVSLSVLPIFARLRDAGLTDLAKFVVPGAIIDTLRTRGALEQVSTVSPPDTLRHLAELRSEIEDATGTYPQSRGATGPTGVTATQTERAFQGLAARNQIKLHRLESDLSSLPPQWLSIAHQFLDDLDISSLNKQSTAELTGQYSLEDFMQSLSMDWAFRASRIVANKELQISNLKDLFTMAVNAFAAMPVSPVALDKLFFAVADKVDPEVSKAIQLSPEEKIAKQQEADAIAAEQPPDGEVESAPSAPAI